MKWQNCDQCPVCLYLFEAQLPATSYITITGKRHILKKGLCQCSSVRELRNHKCRSVTVQRLFSTIQLRHAKKLYLRILIRHSSFMQARAWSLLLPWRGSQIPRPGMKISPRTERIKANWARHIELANLAPHERQSQDWKAHAALWKPTFDAAEHEEHSSLSHQHVHPAQQL